MKTKTEHGTLLMSQKKKQTKKAPKNYYSRNLLKYLFII